MYKSAAAPLRHHAVDEALAQLMVDVVVARDAAQFQPLERRRRLVDNLQLNFHAAIETQTDFIRWGWLFGCNTGCRLQSVANVAHHVEDIAAGQARAYLRQIHLKIVLHLREITAAACTAATAAV